MAYFPLFIELENKIVWVFGGGKVACRKAKTILSYDARVEVYAENFCEELKELEKETNLSLIKTKFYKQGELDFSGEQPFFNHSQKEIAFAIAATDDRGLNHELSSVCRQHGIMVNVADQLEDCDFSFPALVKQKDVTIAVTTGGKSPLLAAQIREELQNHYTGEIGQLAEEMGWIRSYITPLELSAGEKRKLHQEMLEFLQQKLRERENPVPADQPVIRIGGRKSPLSVAQVNIVADMLKAQAKKWGVDIRVEFVPMSTKGDKILNKPLYAFDGKGMFVEEIEDALLQGRIDLAVHSAKDMPGKLKDGLDIIGTPKRKDPRDVLVIPRELVKDGGLSAGNRTLIIGTGSIRREKQIKKLYPGVECKLIRGNVDTRIKKLLQGEYDGIILAAAGIERLEIMPSSELTFIYLNEDNMVPAAGQGIIAIEGRSKESWIKDLVWQATDMTAWLQLKLERGILNELQADCHEMAGVYAQVDGEEVLLRGIYETEGSVRKVKEKFTLPHSDAEIKSIISYMKRKLLGEKGKVYLVGAGPGREDLLTVRGRELLAKCQVLVYDRLAGQNMTDYVPEDCEKIYVGKEVGNHSVSQEIIQEILVRKAGEGKMVVRLKGGDPFVFGRGGEEIEALKAENIPFEVVPGVTSAVAVPELAGIPVTHRGVSRSFHVITGHTAGNREEQADNYQRLASVEGTLVFLMGVSDIGFIVEQLLAGGKNPDTPAAVISQGTTKNQRVVRGIMVELPEIIRLCQLKAPAVVVIGDTAGEDMSDRPCGNEKLPSIGITGTRLFTGRMMEEIRRRHIPLEPVQLSYMEVKPCEDFQQIPPLSGYDWLVFTSGNGVEIFMTQLRRQMKEDNRAIEGEDKSPATIEEQFASVKIAVLGEGTHKKLQSYGLHADYIPDEFTTSALATGLCQQVKPGERVLVARAKQGAEELISILRDKHIDVTELHTYDVVCDKEAKKEAVNQLKNLDMIVFASASGVHGLLQECQEPVEELLANTTIICIGEMTAKALTGYDISDFHVASMASSKGIIQLLYGLMEEKGRE